MVRSFPMRTSLLLLLLLAGEIAFCQSPTLTIDRTAGPTRVKINGQAGATYNLDYASSLPASNWNFLITTALTNASQSWFDAESAVNPERWYRATKLAVPPSDFPYDFRLIDQIGRSRSLYYSLSDTNVRAVVLIFSGNGCQKMQQMIPTIKALTNRFAPNGVLFWLIDSNQQDNRSNILAQAVAWGISNSPPILHDSAQLVARAYNATTTPEAVAISTDMQVFYRGAIDDRLASNAVSTTQYYLSNALVSFLAGGPIAPSRARTTGCAITLTPPMTNISYSTQIAPLLQANCVRCHSPGNIAPWAMTNYSSVYDSALLIKLEVLANRMPPWKADPHYGSFTNDISLTAAQAKMLIQWIDDGAYKAPAEPDPLASAPPQTNYPFAWPAALGQPDAILKIPLQSIPSTGVLNYRYINVANNAFSSNVWLRAAVLKPTNTRVVHHALVFDGTTMGQGLDGFFSGYVPGADATSFPPGTGKYLTNGQMLQFQMHYITVGTPETDQTELGLYKLASPPAYPLQTRSAYNVLFSVPANSRTYESIAKFPSPPTFNQALTPLLTNNILLFEMSPHMHLRGLHFRYEVIYPSGHVPATETILSVPSYVFHWQSMFRLAQPKFIPTGSRILCTAGWDNTINNTDLMEAYVDSNLDPLLSPNRQIGFGEQTYDEMFIGYLNYADVP